MSSRLILQIQHLFLQFKSLLASVLSSEVAQTAEDSDPDLSSAVDVASVSKELAELQAVSVSLRHPRV